MSVVDITTGEVLTDAEVIREFTEDEARNFVQRINHSVAIAGDLIIEAYERRIWKALGYSTWDDFAAAEIGVPEMSASSRAVLAVGLRQAGMSYRAIAAATGSSEATARRDTAQVRHDDAPAVTGTDGKSYPAKRPERDATQQEGAGDDGSPCEGDDAECVDGADSHDVGRIEPEPAPATSDPGESDDREASGGTSNPDSSPGSTTNTPGAFAAKVAKAIERAGDLMVWQPEDVAGLNDPQIDDGIRLMFEALTGWVDRYRDAKPSGLIAIQGGKQ